MFAFCNLFIPLLVKKIFDMKIFSFFRLCNLLSLRTKGTRE